MNDKRITFKNFIKYVKNNTNIWVNDVQSYLIKCENKSYNNNYGGCIWFIYINDDVIDFDVFNSFREIDRKKSFIIHYNSETLWKLFSMWKYELSTYFRTFI